MVPWVIFTSPKVPRPPNILVAMVNMVATILPPTQFIFKIIAGPRYIPRRKIYHIDVELKVVIEASRELMDSGTTG
jgi:hypothetical protein